MDSLEKAADWLRTHFDPKAARDLEARVVLELRGPSGGSLLLEIDGGRLVVERGGWSTPDVLLRLDADDCFALLAGRENAELLLMDGRIEVEGRLSLAMRLRSLFPSRE